MNKLLKLTGVSILTIMATANANAAGYTCEELIEYTSCNTGYALLDGDCVCDGGYYTNGDKCTICPIGTYSSVNASECTTCPTTGLVDPDDKAIVATTASTGSKNISACIIPTNVTIKGTTGLYHFKSTCTYSVPSEQEACEIAEVPDLDGSVGGTAEWDGAKCRCGGDTEWIYNPATGIGVCRLDEQAPATPYYDCLNELGGTWDYDNMTCNCTAGTEFVYDASVGGYSCGAYSISDEEECGNVGGDWGADVNSKGVCVCDYGWKENPDGSLICEE